MNEIDLSVRFLFLLTFGGVAGFLIGYIKGAEAKTGD
jgi:hypothetical protein